MTVAFDVFPAGGPLRREHRLSDMGWLWQRVAIPRQAKRASEAVIAWGWHH